MAHLTPQIPTELSDIIAKFNSKIKFKNYHSDANQYKSLSKYISKHDSKNDVAENILENSREQLIAADDILWASKKYGLLIILQGMDTAGKDGIISHVLSGVNPQGCRVASFKVPTQKEHNHDFLWRYVKCLPERGEITIFNRSYYEDVLVTKVHPECMEKLPTELDSKQNKNFWINRFDDINNFEKHLARNGTIIVKFFLHISKNEQKSRLLDRLSNEDKFWKISSSDFKERQYWDKYVEAYEDMLSNTSQSYAPWIIVPANNKKVARAIVGHTIAGIINGLNISYPTISKNEIELLRQAKEQLENE